MSKNEALFLSQSYNDTWDDYVRSLNRPGFPEGWVISLRQKQKKLIMLPSETMIWQPEFTDKTLSRKPGAVHIACERGSKSAVRITPPRHSPHICLFLCADDFNANNRLSRRCWRSSTAY